MATSKKVIVKEKSRVKTKTKVAEQQKTIRIIGIVAVVAAIFIWFMNSSFWPWPSSKEIEHRLNEVITICMHDERSRECSSIQDKYRMSFEYCHSLADIPEIGKNIPVYGVARINNLETRELNYNGGDKTLSKYPYYSCSDYLENIDKDNTSNLLASEPTTTGLFALYNVPQYGTSGDYYKCSSKQLVSWNFLWNQIPNIDKIKDEYKAAFDSNSKCSQLSDLKNRYNAINAKLKEYANNKTVQQFYKHYDDWAAHYRGKINPDYDESISKVTNYCVFMDKEFNQRCGDVTEFADEMRSYISTKDFTSKIVAE